MAIKELNIANNILYLRRINHMSIEELANEINVSRQAVAKWEHGESIPDVVNCLALAEIFEVSIDNLLHYDGSSEEISIAPKGKHFFGMTKIGHDGEVVLPKEAREIFHWHSGDELVILGDEHSDHPGIALISSDDFMKTTRELLDQIYPQKGPNKSDN
ncbi:helix-turn-helix domain-containing protein [Isobaculum melis]|uniref:Looped-hinge helix DNA binding domain-containing protein, AbrB family n=1 Tax=Isobaculum melis TaxID=142588 RepID=A0A1H9PNM1_9LACT|nr:helix-turn-helix domain-containing protein [Isobaculum melis]SER49409.1 looped-hinge helix DNA binding domain-containing protein, AbrB family [Isobaculum melis]